MKVFIKEGLCSTFFRNTNKDFTAINNAYTRDERLDVATIGILTVILTNKEDWVVYPEEIARRLKISRRTVDKHFRILENAGYLKVFKTNHGHRKGIVVYRFFSDKPMSEEFVEYLKKVAEAN